MPELTIAELREWLDGMIWKVNTGGVRLTNEDAAALAALRKMLDAQDVRLSLSRKADGIWLMLDGEGKNGMLFCGDPKGGIINDLIDLSIGNVEDKPEPYEIGPNKIIGEDGNIYIHGISAGLDAQGADNKGGMLICHACGTALGMIEGTESEGSGKVPDAQVPDEERKELLEFIDDLIKSLGLPKPTGKAKQLYDKICLILSAPPAPVVSMEEIAGLANTIFVMCHSSGDYQPIGLIETLAHAFRSHRIEVKEKP